MISQSPHSRPPTTGDKPGRVTVSLQEVGGIFFALLVDIAIWTTLSSSSHIGTIPQSTKELKIKAHMSHNNINQKLT